VRETEGDIIFHELFVFIINSSDMPATVGRKTEKSAHEKEEKVLSFSDAC